MIATRAELLEALHANGLADDAALALPESAVPTERPWFIGLLLGAAGWAAGVLVLVFVALSLSRGSGSGGGILATGLVLLAMAFGLFHAARHSGFAAFASQAALALSIAGQFATVFGIAEAAGTNWTRQGSAIACIALVMQVALAAAMPNRLHRTMSTLFACIAWAVALRLAFHESPLAIWPITWLPIAGALFVIVRNEAAWIARGLQDIVRPVSSGLIVGLALGTLASEPLDFLGAELGRTAESAFAPWPLLSAIAALAALAGAFALGNPGLAGLCIAAAVGHLFHLYYATGATLLAKAATLAILGVACIALAMRMRKAPRP